MTVAEKISQLGDESPAVPRLGVPAYKWWSEALHGVSDHGRGVHLSGPLRAATSFPQVILTAASFNPHLWYRIGQVTAPALRLLLHSPFVNARAGHARPAVVFTCPLCCARRTSERVCFTTESNDWYGFSGYWLMNDDHSHIDIGVIF
jgi:hypothetical protein